MISVKTDARNQVGCDTQNSIHVFTSIIFSHYLQILISHKIMFRV